MTTIQPSLPRQTHYALFDLDGTLSKGFISMAFLDYVHEHGLYDPQEYTHQMDILGRYQRHQLSYDDWVTDWGRTWARGLKGQHESDVRQAAAAFFETYRATIYPEGRDLVTDLKAHGFENIMVSAGVYEVVDLARQALGMDQTMATRCQEDHGVYTGELETSLHTPTGKGEAVGALAAQAGPPTFAFGDTSGDVSMLKLARVPVCLNANADLTATAEREGWAHMPIAQAPAFVHQKLEEEWLIAGPQLALAGR